MCLKGRTGINVYKGSEGAKRFKLSRVKGSYKVLSVFKDLKGSQGYVPILVVGLTGTKGV